MSRCLAIRAEFGESQAQFAPRIGVSQACIARLERGQREGGAVRLVLDQVAREIGRPDLVSPQRLPMPPRSRVRPSHEKKSDP